MELRLGLLMVRRDRHDIVMEILKLLKSGSKKTRLMKDVNLSFVQAQMYLGILEKEGLIKTDGNGVFWTTDKGLQFIDKCEECFLCNWHQKETRLKPPRKP